MSDEVRNLTVPRGTFRRPPHVTSSLETLYTVAVEHENALVCGELVNVARYVLQLEREAAAVERPSAWRRFVGWWRS